jgi:hypothetical protein
MIQESIYDKEKFHGLINFQQNIYFYFFLNLLHKFVQENQIRKNVNVRILFVGSGFDFLWMQIT